MCSLHKKPEQAGKRRPRLPVKEIIDKLDEAVTKELQSESSANANPPPLQATAAERQQAERELAMASIRRFCQADALTLYFVSVALNPYASDGRTMEIYEDNRNYEYWIEPSDNRLIQAAPAAHQPASSHKIGPAERIPIPELRELALQLISRQVPNFKERRSQLHPLEDNRQRQVYFFRFDDFSQPVPESELPPFVQVGLRADGQLISFTNTLI